MRPENGPAGRTCRGRRALERSLGLSSSFMAAKIYQKLTVQVFFFHMIIWVLGREVAVWSCARAITRSSSSSGLGASFPTFMFR